MKDWRSIAQVLNFFVLNQDFQLEDWLLIQQIRVLIEVEIRHS